MQAQAGGTSMTKQVIAQIPPAARFTEQDAGVILKYKDVLLGWEKGLVQGFYDALYAHDATRAVFNEGERPAREKTLVAWYRRTLNGPFDDDYWEWQTFVGLVHIKRQVNNAMVSGMWGWILNYLSMNILARFPAGEALPLIKALHALQATVFALIAEGFQRNYYLAVDKAAGINEKLLHRLVATEIDGMMEDARPSL
jgi:hypothetical protein